MGSDSLRRFQADSFQGLAHPTRIALVELLAGGEMSAGTLIEKLGMEQANVSQHLAVLRARKIVSHRKTGSRVFYSLRDPILVELLGLMRRYLQQHVRDSLQVLDGLDEPPRRKAK